MLSMTDTLSEPVAELLAIDDVLARATSSHTAYRNAAALAEQLRNIRDLALNELRHSHGMSCRHLEREFTGAGAPLSKSAIAGITG